MSLPLPDLHVEKENFKVADVVCSGFNGEKGKIIDIYKTLGTYYIYKGHLMTSGNVMTAARHELVKGFPDEHLQDLFDAFQVHKYTVRSRI